MDSAGPDKEFMATLAKGLAVIQAFGERPKLTLSDAAEAVGLSRAAARRVLRTLTPKTTPSAPTSNAAWIG